MGVNDILGKYGGGPYVDFEFLAPNSKKPGKMKVKKIFTFFGGFVMKIEINISKYMPKDGLQLEWEDNSSIKVISHGEVNIKANCAGLVSLARLLLTLAQEEVPNGYHIHLDENNSLEDDSDNLVIERNDFI